MLVMILENVPPALRGELSRWLIQPKAGIFVGKVSALVRDKLWDLCLERYRATAMIQIWSDANEQGFSLRAHGETSCKPIDVEGVCLMLRPNVQPDENLSPSQIEPVP